MLSQVTDTLLMIQPVAFKKNEETAQNNFYQKDLTGVSDREIQERALYEFEQFVSKLRAKGIEVIIIKDAPQPPSPDSIFPNNWISLHEEGNILLYPMYAENRRKERRELILEELKTHFQVTDIDRSLIAWEEKDIFLEGTGSMILDRQNKITYAAISERTHPDALAGFCRKTGYRSIGFVANQTVNQERLPIYHTNVMMCLGEKFAVVCLDTIDDKKERQTLTSTLESTGKEVIAITEDQNNHFAGNMLQVKNATGERFIGMSEAAYQSLDPQQIECLEKHGEIIHSSLDTIETLGGGSARCMMAEVFLPKKN